MAVRKLTRQDYLNKIALLELQLKAKDSQLQTMLTLWSQTVRGSKDSKPISKEQLNVFGGKIDKPI